jgi:hypothetical protein
LYEFKSKTFATIHFLMSETQASRVKVRLFQERDTMQIVQVAILLPVQQSYGLLVKAEAFWHSGTTCHYMIGVAGVFDNCLGLPLTQSGVQVLDGRQLSSSDVLAAVGGQAVAVPGRDTINHNFFIYIF